MSGMDNDRILSHEDKTLLHERLNPIDSAYYRDDRGCMEGTRVQIINDIVLWAIKPSSEELSSENSNAEGMLWVYGMPGIGKSAIAHSICHRLHETKQLGGSFFCGRDDPNRSETKLVLPTLIYGLASVFGPFRKQMAQALRDDPQLTPQLASGELFLHTLQSLEVHPPRSLVLVIDALDECGEPGTRKRLLERLLKACRRQKWLKTIVISRPEHDIQSFFIANGVVGLDLGQADHNRTDIRHFTKTRMQMVAERRHVSQYPEPWVGERRLGHIVNRSGGLFIFVETLSQYLMKYPNPKPPLDRLLEGPSEEASIELHKLYLVAIESRVDSEEAESRLIARVVIGVAPHRALCDEAIAAFTGLELGIVSSWVDDLSSLLYRDPTLQGGIRARHISILEYFTGSSCPLDFRVDLKQADTELGTYCLQTMITKLRFNMCKLETSYRANSEIEDLGKRVQGNIPDILQYSCLYWSNHLCSSMHPASKEVCEYLDTFLRGERVLYWLEVLSVMGRVPAAIGALRKIIACRKIFAEEIVNLAEDALRFVLAFLTPISTSAPHIYLSALPFAPSESSLWKTTCSSFPKVMKITEGRMTKWPKVASVWKGHTNYVTSIAYSPDGLNVVSGSFDNTVRIWDATTGTPVGEPLKEHTSSVQSVAYSPDGLNIVSGSLDHTIRIWDAATGEPIGEPLKGHTSGIMCVAYSPDGRNIVSGSRDKTIRIWDAATGTPTGDPLTGHRQSVDSVAYSPNGLNIVSGADDYTIRIWDARTGAPVGSPLEGHTYTVRSVAYSPNGRNIISGSFDNTVRIWDVATGSPVYEPLKGSAGGVTSVAYSPDGRSIISSSGSDSTIRIWDAATGIPTGEPLTGHHRMVTSVAYSPDGRRFASGSYDHTIRIWDAATGKPIAETLTGHADLIASIAYSPDGLNIVSGSWDQTIRIWDPATGFLVREPLKGHDSKIMGISYSPDGRNVVSGHEDNAIRIWDVPTGALIGEPLKGHLKYITGVVYSPEGRHIASCSDDSMIRIWNATTGMPVGEPLKGHTDSVWSVAWSPDGQNIASGSNDGTIRIWDIATGIQVNEPLKGHDKGVKSVAYSPDGRSFVSGSLDRMIRIWDAATGVPVGEPLKGHTGGVSCAAWSPDGQNIVSGSYDHTLRIWDTATGAAVGDPLKGHLSNITSLIYSPDGRYIVSGSQDQTIRVWDARQIPNSGRTASSEYFDPTLHTLHKLFFDLPGPSAIPRTGLDSKAMDSEGWVRCDDGLLLWIPEDCRHGVTSHAIKVIPTEARQRPVRLDLSSLKYGKSWTDVYHGT